MRGWYVSALPLACNEEIIGRKFIFPSNDSSTVLHTLVISDSGPVLVTIACRCFCTTQGNLTVANINRNPTNCYWIHCNNDAIYMKNKTIKIKTIFLKLCAHDVTLRRIIPANHGLSGAQKERNWMMGGNTFWLRAGRGVWNHRRYTTDAVLLSSLILWLRNRIKNYFRGLIKIQMEILYHSNTTLVYTLRESCHSLFILILTFCCASCMY